MQHLKFKTGYLSSLFVLLAACQTPTQNEASSTLAGEGKARSTTESSGISSVLVPVEVTAGASLARP